MKKIKKIFKTLSKWLMKDRRFAYLAPVFILTIFCSSYAWDYLANILYPEVEENIVYQMEYPTKWEILLNFLHEIKSGNRQVFDLFNLEYHDFDEILDEEVIEFTKDRIKLVFYASTTWDSLHEYSYVLYFDEGWGLIEVKEESN